MATTTESQQQRIVELEEKIQMYDSRNTSSKDMSLDLLYTTQKELEKLQWSVDANMKRMEAELKAAVSPQDAITMMEKGKEPLRQHANMLKTQVGVGFRY